MTGELRVLWNDAPLWRGSVYLTLACTSILMIDLMTGVRSQTSPVSTPVPPPIATGRGTYASPFAMSPAVQMAAPSVPAAVSRPSTSPVASGPASSRIKPTHNLDPSLVEEIERETQKDDSFAVMPRTSRPRPRTLDELQ